MSRPPRSRAARSPAGAAPSLPGALDYLPLDYAGLLALEEDLAVPLLGRQPSQAGQGPAGADVARTLMELAALTGHVLSVYQRQFAREAFISTAAAPSSLLRHAERLGYQPDPGVAASGHVVFTTKPGVAGTVPARLPLASTPLGEAAAQTYETLDDLAADHALNDLVPADAAEPVTMPAGQTALTVAGTGLGLRPGDLAVLAAPAWTALVIASVGPGPDGQTTVIEADRALPALAPASAPISLLARPALVARPFGVTADPVLFPPKAIASATGTKPATAIRTKPATRMARAVRPPGGGPVLMSPPASEAYWFTVSRPDGGTYLPADIYLSEALPQVITGQVVVRRAGASMTALSVTAQATVSVTLNREVRETFPTQVVTVTPKDGGGFVTSATPSTGTQTAGGHVSGTVTAIQVKDSAGQPVNRTQSPFPAEWLGDWQVATTLAPSRPSAAPVTQPLILPGQLAALTPGRALVFTTSARDAAQVVTVRRAEIDAGADVTRVWWDDLTPLPAPGWTWRRGDLHILGNVARISHGRTIEEPLGSSDGVTPFQSFPLKENPVTMLPSASGSAPELKVRVNDVAWDAVTDFAGSGPDDRHYRVRPGPDGATVILFGDGQQGAVPPAGRRNITAVYRVGLGLAGDAAAGRITRIKRSHPLLDRAVNLTAVTGGADPARPEQIRSLATRWIRTFDRAVSASDLADLSLSIPGIARASARFDPVRGLSLTLATPTGELPPALAPIRAFLDDRRDTSVPLRFVAPAPRDVQLSVLVTTDPAYLVEAVKASVRATLHGDSETAPGMFTFAARDLGQPAFRSEVYARLEALPGVIGVQVTRFGSRDADGLADQIPADPDEWLRLQPNDLTLDTAAAGRDG